MYSIESIQGSSGLTDYRYLVRNDYGTVATCYVRANAEMICDALNAAPDLLAALEAMQDGYLGTKEQFDAAWEQASAAIRKAKGDE